MEQNKRLLIAFILSLGILLLFQKIQGPKNTSNSFQTNALQQTEERASQQEKASQNIDLIDSEQTSTKTKSSSKNEKEIIFETDDLEIVFSDQGGVIKEISVKGEEENEELLSPKAADIRPFSIKSSALLGVEGGSYQVREDLGFLEFTKEIPGKQILKKTYFIDKGSNYIELEISTKNISKQEQEFSYLLVGPSGMQEMGAVKGRHFVEATVDIDGGIVRKNSVNGQWEQEGQVGWTAIKNRYFGFIVRPFKQVASAIISGGKGSDLVVGVKTSPQYLQPGEKAVDKYLLYIGPLSEGVLKEAGYGFEKIINYGWFGGISKVLLTTLRILHNGLKNWGLAIICLTIIVNLLSFPLTKKSFLSMQQMKNIQPHMQKLKEVHKDNPQKLNKEMMELYKKYNVNPFGGCLPMILQIPIFIALYQGLIKAVELKGATFLWIKDLAKPDAVGLPFSLPLIGNHINILPLAMAIMMFLQQKAQGNAAAGATDEQAQQQKMMHVMMPVLFGFLFYNMPSGLVLYWLTNTCLMTSEQFLLKKSLPGA